MIALCAFARASFQTQSWEGKSGCGFIDGSHVQRRSAPNHIAAKVRLSAHPHTPDYRGEYSRIAKASATDVIYSNDIGFVAAARGNAAIRC